MNWGAIGAVAGILGLAFGAGAFVQSAKETDKTLSEKIDTIEQIVNQPIDTLPLSFEFHKKQLNDCDFRLVCRLIFDLNDQNLIG